MRAYMKPETTGCYLQLESGEANSFQLNSLESEGCPWCLQIF